MKYKKPNGLVPLAQTMAVLGVVWVLMMIKPCEAQDLTYCKNYETGEIIVVDNGVCPYPTVQI